MAEIHPNDIGLATFADVGNVERLRTSAKTVVEAINEIYQTGGSQSVLGDQLYIDGENNVIFGTNNAVYGSNNLIIGSNNVLVGSGHNLIGSERYIYTSPPLSFEWFDVSLKRLYFYVYEENVTIPFKVGDKILLSFYQSWADSEWTDWISVYTPIYLTEITEVSESGGYITVAEMKVSEDPPDDIHVIYDYGYTNYSIVLCDEYAVNGSSTGVLIGNSSTGTRSFSANYGNAKGAASFAANGATASSNYSSAFGSSNVVGSYGFGAGYCGKVNADYSSTFNYYTYCYSPYSNAFGYYSRIYGRPLKCTAINNTAKTLTLASGQTTTSLAGKKLILRCYNSNNTIMFPEVTISSVSGTTIYLASDSYMGGSGSYAYSLFPDGYVFVVDTSSSYSMADFVAGYYCLASSKYTFAQGYFNSAFHEGAAIFGKYGITQEPYSLVLGNGTSLKAPGVAFKVLSDGSVHADGEYTSPCADYAEYFEWEDGNPHNEDRAGYFVKLNGEKIVKCSGFDKPLGIVSAMPAIIGDSGEMHWKGKFLTDDFGRVQYHDVIVPAEFDEEGNLINEEHTERQPVINPEWNAKTEYVPRKSRPEWSPVGVLGKLIVYDDGTLVSGDICRPGEDGKAVKSIENGYPVLRRIADDKVLIWFKG